MKIGLKRFDQIIQSLSLVSTLGVDQRSNGGTWVSLGTYFFDGVDDYVELSESPNGEVYANAIKWKLQP